MPLKKTTAFAAFGLLTVGALAYRGSFSALGAMNYLPHRYCYLAQPWLIWSNVTMDALIAASYVAIFSCLLWITSRLRRIPEIRGFLWIFLSFGLFIVACASTHVMEVVTVWWPLYRLSVAFKLVCAAASVATAILFGKAVPELIRGIQKFLDTLSTSQQAYVSGLVERDQMRGEFRNSQAHLQAILDNVLDSIIMIDATGTIVSTNAAVASTFGYQPGELAGKNIKLLMPEPDRGNHDGHLARYQSTGMTKAIGVGRELEGLTRSGKVFPMELTVSELSLDGQRMFVGLIRDISERKQAEVMRDRFAAVVDSSDDAIISKTLEGIIIAWNRGAEKVFGYSASEAVGQPMLMLLPAERIDEEYDILARIRRGESVEHFETVRVRKDGTEIDVSATISPIRDSHGVVVGASKIARDITARRHAEDALQESKEQFQAMANGMPQLAWIADADGSIVWYNQRWYQFTGTSFEQMQGWGWQTVHDPDFLPIVMERWKAAIRAGVPFEMEFPLRGADGNFRAFLTRVMPLKSSAGQVVRWFGTNTDISERKLAEERLALQAEELRHSRLALENQTFMLQSVLDSMVEGLVAADKQGKFILWNPAAEAMLGIDAAGVPGAEWNTRCGAYLPDGTTPISPGDTPLERAIRGERCSAEIFLRSPQLGREFWIEANASPLRDHLGMLHGGVVAFRDVTRKKADELEIRKLNENLEEKIAKRTEQLAAANRELEAFSYSVSHDLRTPLRHIAGFSRILMREHGEGMAGEAREHLQRIETAVRRMGELVDALLKMATLRRQSLRLQPTDLSPIVEQVISLLRVECEGRDVEWQIEQLPVLNCDPVLMAQVFQNLLSNALKYSRGQAKAVIEVGSVEQAGLPAVILVRDNGAGFDMNYAEKLFGMFQRLHTDAEFEGTGVGLATVHRIIEKHQGIIWAEAEPGCGACFYFALEVSEESGLALKATMAKIRVATNDDEVSSSTKVLRPI
jgi:hypothetical protein